MSEKIRRLTQFVSALAINAHFFVTGQAPIYQGNLKHLCVPVLNCYSCPLSVAACPIGAIQSALSTMRPVLRAGGGLHLGIYSLGTIGMVGSIVGRMPCGWLCPFGLLQDYLFRIETKKFQIPEWMGYIRFAVLLAMVILIPVLLVDAMGYGETTFCKYLCPVGTLEAGIPLLALKPELRRLMGPLFAWKFIVLVLVVAWAVLSSRPFCRTLCPLGAILGLFNKASLFRLDFDPDTCVQCGACRTICPTGVSFFDGTHSPNSPSCIRCLKCYSICPVHAISITIEKGKGSIQCAPGKNAS